MNPILAGYTVFTLAMALVSLLALRRAARRYRQFARAVLARTAELEEQVHRGIIVCEAKGPVREGAFVAIAEQGEPS